MAEFKRTGFTRSYIMSLLLSLMPGYIRMHGILVGRFFSEAFALHYILFSTMCSPIPDANPPLSIHRSLFLPVCSRAHIPAEHFYHTPKKKKGLGPSIHPSRRSESMSERPRKGMQDEKCYRNAVLMKYVSKGKSAAVSSAGVIIYKNDS